MKEPKFPRRRQKNGTLSVVSSNNSPWDPRRDASEVVNIPFAPKLPSPNKGIGMIACKKCRNYFKPRGMHTHLRHCKGKGE